MKLLTILIISTSLFANTLQNNCLKCHSQNSLPDSLIYKRYLQKFSSKKRIKKAMLNYLKNPNQKNSIMPNEFFKKFSIKPKSRLNNTNLSKNIDEYIKKYDLQKRLYIEKR